MNVPQENLISWFKEFKNSSHYTFLQKRPLAYFCIEYALSDFLPTYAGGLGILARDFVKEMADQKFPGVAVGLLYHQPYGTSDEHNMPSDAHLHNKQLTTVFDEENKPILVKIPIQDHIVYAKAWMWQKDTIPVYLLDTNIPENNAQDRNISRQLYSSNKEIRLKQEIILGIGGFRLLELLNIDPSIIHMNEGHSSLLGLEFIHQEMQKNHISFHEAVAVSCRRVVFTNHTLVPAGNEIFSNELFTLLLESYAQEIAVPVADILSLGVIKESSSFSMTLFALNIAGKSNAVSNAHAKKASEVWPDFEFQSITNGIHLSTWDGVMHEDPVVAHTRNKRELLHYINHTTDLKWSENQLLLGWARRFVPYKRPLALFEEINQLKAFVFDQKMPLRIVIAGLAPPGYEDAHELLQILRDIINKELPGMAVYLPEYNNSLSYKLITGTDIWLNTPVVGSEACGTSGMKAALNGSLPLSTKDGWVDEVDLTEIGWILDNDSVTQSIMENLRENIVPLYYQEKDLWEKRVYNARALITSQFSTTRMLHDYIMKMYIPTLDKIIT